MSSEPSEYELVRDAIIEHLHPDDDDIAEVAILIRAVEEAAHDIQLLAQRELAAQNAIIAADALLDTIQRSPYMAAKLDLDIQAYREQASMYRALLMREKD